MDYDRHKLEEDDNPIALVILASQEKELARQKGEAFNVKRRLIRSMYEKGYKREEILALFNFIDWTLRLDDKEEEIILEEIREIEGVKNMPYVNSAERLGMKRGLQQGLQQNRELILEALNERFDKVTSEIAQAVNQIEDTSKLKLLIRYAIRCKTLEEFEQWLNGKSKRE